MTDVYDWALDLLDHGNTPFFVAVRSLLPGEEGTPALAFIVVPTNALELDPSDAFARACTFIGGLRKLRETVTEEGHSELVN